MRDRLEAFGGLTLALIASTAFSSVARPVSRTVSSFTIHRTTVNGTVDRTFIPSATAFVGNLETSLRLTVKGSFLDLATGADVVNSSGSVVSGTSATITRRQGGADTQIDITVDGLRDKPGDNYRVRIHYAVETNGPDLVRLRLLETPVIDLVTRDATPAAIAGVYDPIQQNTTYRLNGTGLQFAIVDPSRAVGTNITVLSRTKTQLVYTVRPMQPGRYQVKTSAFFDENLGHVPTESEDREMSVRGIGGGGGPEVAAVAVPAVGSITPQPAGASGSIVLNGSNLTGGGLSLSRIRYGHRYTLGTEEVQVGSTATAQTFSLQPTSAVMLGAYDIASQPIELRFVAEASIKSPPNATPDLTMTVRFASAYPPSIEAVKTGPTQVTTLSGVTVLKPGSVTVSGKFLFASSPPAVKLGTLPLTVTATKYVLPTDFSGGGDSVRFTLPDPADNVFGQFHIETESGSANAPSSYVLVTRPRVSSIRQVTVDGSSDQLVTDQTLRRGRDYLINGTSLSVKTSSQLLQRGTVRIGTREAPLENTSDPNVQLRFSVPVDASTGPLVVSSLGGETTVGTFTVIDAAPGTVPVPRPRLVTIAPASVPAGVPAAGSVTLDNAGSTVAGFTVALSSSDPTIATVPATISVSGTLGQFPIATKTVAATSRVMITATSGGESQSQTFNVTPPVPSSLSLTAIDVVAGATPRGTLSFTAPAPNTTAVLASSDAAAVVPPTVAVVGSSAIFPINTTEAPVPRTVTITGSANGVTQSATVTITPLRIQSLTPSTDRIRASETATFTAVLNLAPASDVELTVATSHPTIVQFNQPSLRIPAGQTTGAIGIRVVTPPSAPTDVAVIVSRSVVTAGFGTVTISSTRHITIVP